MTKIQEKLFINNEYVVSHTNERLKVYNPYDGSLVSNNIEVALEEDVDLAVSAAQAALPIWQAMTGAQRSALMLRYADLVEKHTEEIAQLESQCMGSPMMLARRVVGSHVAVFRYYAGLTDKIAGTTYTEDGDGFFKMVLQEAIGVCAGIGAWNATPIFAGWKIAPAVAAGNTFVFKASEKSPLGALYLGQLFREAGFPPGVVNMVSGGPATGALLASHMGIAKIAYTGSVSGGRAVQLAAAKSNLKPVTLELGGKSAAIVFDDAHLESAITHCSQTFALNGAQVCSAASRVLVHRDIADTFIAGVSTAFKQLAAAHGPPNEALFGPLVDQQHHQRVQAFVDAARDGGVGVVAGEVPTHPTALFMPPTLLIDPPINSRAYREEIFGPVLAVKTFSTEQEAIALANDSSYGLAAAVFTSSMPRALRVTRALQVGMVGVNSPVMPLTQLPWGGCKESGYGREGGLAGLEEYLQSKTVLISMKDPQASPAK
ncbi:putative aldehyde dehydrogenase-like protein [Alternaria arborescens]|uniref:aldehyde dehydrogenase (NAD(+)) n=1 Tax=Alternaria arborescens TaxID=156630 RepID=A0A4Q4S5Q1_9PLEO|nr:putative aldehyde dehydrogenase-like protein [Alternaria arborescens]RYO32723.1 putative aldehyde dehydrogenase-like protein [Alternaria arborescens]RYO65317.1 putative aldehyde dehydrogenase-like protein [Alternaria arborescens]